MSRKRITYRPNKASSALSGGVGVVFILIGLFVAIPMFGAFGILWTIIAVGITAVNLYQGFGKNYVGPEIRIEEEGTDGGRTDSVEERMKQLRSLYDQRLITQEEYETKRQEILKEL